MLVNRFDIETVFEKNMADSLIVTLRTKLKPVYKTMLSKRKNSGRGGETFVNMMHFDIDDIIDLLSIKHERKQVNMRRAKKLRAIKKLKKTLKTKGK